MNRLAEKYGDAQHAAIMITDRVARKLLGDNSGLCDQMVAMRREGHTQVEIAASLMPPGIVSEKVAKCVVSKIMMARLSEDERVLFNERIQEDGGRNLGTSMVEQERGIHALSSDEKAAAARKSYKKGLGLLSDAQRSRNSIEANRAQGYQPWNEPLKNGLFKGLTELSVLRIFSQLPEFHYKGGKTLRMDELVERYNLAVHGRKQVRSKKAIANQLSKITKASNGEIPSKTVSWLGQVPGSELTEDEYLKSICMTDAYGSPMGEVNYEALAEHLNSLVHRQVIRTRRAIEARLIHLGIAKEIRKKIGRLKGARDARIVELCNNSDFKWKTGRNAGGLKSSKIRQKIQDEFSVKVSTTTIKRVLRGHKK